MSKAHAPIALHTPEAASLQRSLLDLLPAAVIVTRYNGTLVYCNQRVTVEFGFEAGRNIQDFYANPAERKNILEAIRQQGQLENLEVCFRKPDGTPVWTLFSARSFEFEGDEAILSALVDITAQKQTEERVAKEKENFRKIFSAAPVGLLLLDDDTVIKNANQAIGAIILRDPVEMIAQRAGGGLNCVHSTEHPQGCGFGKSCNLCPLRLGLESVLSNGPSIQGAEIAVDLLISGQPQQRWLRINVEPIEIEGRRHLVVALDDITKSKELEAEIQKNARRLALAVSATADAIWEWNLKTGQTYYSPRWYEMLGYADQEFPMTFETWQQLCHPDDFQSATDSIQQTLDAPDSAGYQVEFRMKAKNDAWVWILGRGSVVARDADGHPLLLSGTNTDITERRRADEELRRSEEKYHSVVSALREGIVLQDKNGVIQASNASAERILGLSADQMMGLTSIDPRWRAIHEDGSPFPGEAHPAMETLRTGEPLADVVMGIHKPDGTLTWISMNSQPLKAPSADAPQAVVVSFTDITERKRAEDNQALQAGFLGILHRMEHAITSSMGLNRILDLLAGEIVKQLHVDACALLLLNPRTNRLDFAAKKGFRTKALDATKLTIGTGLAGQAAEKLKIVHIANLPQIADANPVLLKAIRGEKFISYFGVPLIVKDQLLGVLEIFHRAELAPAPDWLEFLDTLAQQAAISIDNARLLEMTQQSLKETNALYSINQYLIATIDHELLMTNVVDLLQKNFGYHYVQIFVADPQTGNFNMRVGSGKIGQKLKAEGYFLTAGEGIVGFTAETGKPFFTNDVDKVISFVRMPYLPDTKSELAVPIKVGEQFLGLLDVHQAPPALLTERDMQLVSAIADQLAVALQKARMYADLQNALQQEQATRAQLIQAEKLTLAGRLLASVSHELNNPIQAIQNALFLLREERAISVQGKQDLDIVLSETDRMATMLERLRATYQPTSRDEFQPVQINDLIEDTCALVATHLRHSRISYAFLADPDLPPISGMANQLRQVILNLVMNAVDAMSGGGHLTLATQLLRDKDEVLVEITDTGTGIDAAILPNIFEAFVTNKEQGTGLGLAISYEIILKHQGRIEARNNPERGATFSVWLPVGDRGGK